MLVETQYFPSTYFWAMAQKDKNITIEAHENYQKRSFRNKCKILAANGVLNLSIPLEKGKNSKMPIKEVRISYVESWQGQHLQSIRSAYGSSPYFEFYWDPIEALIRKKQDFLYDFNAEILQFLCSTWNIKLSESIDYEIKTDEIDLRHKNLPTIPYTFPEYPQVFNEKFEYQSNLSAIDLLFCIGPESILYLKKLAELL